MYSLNDGALYPEYPRSLTCARERVASERGVRSVVVRSKLRANSGVRKACRFAETPTFLGVLGDDRGVYSAGKFEDFRTATRNEPLFYS
jgi:hypothetical protein